MKSFSANRKCQRSAHCQNLFILWAFLRSFQINIQLGIYHVYWQELTRLFPMEQIMVLQNQDLDDMTRVMDRVYGFLDMRK